MVFVRYVLLDVLFFHCFSFGHCVSVLRFTSIFKAFLQLAFIFLFFQIGHTEEGERFCRFQQNMEGL